MLTKKIKDIKNRQMFEKNELVKIKFTGGGNNEPCIKQYLTKNKIKEVKGFLLFTDGYIHHQPDFPQAKNYLFLLATGGSDDIVKKFGPTYTIDIPTQ